MKDKMILKFMFLVLRVLEELLMARLADPASNVRVIASLIDEVRRLQLEAR